MSDVAARLPALAAPAAPTLGELAAATGGAVGLAALAAADGGYFPPAWGCAALVIGWVVVVTLLVGQMPVVRRELAFVGLLAAVTLWTWLSAAWSPAAGNAFREGFRSLLLPLTAAVAFVVLTRTRLAGRLVVAWAGIAVVCAYALATRLVSDRLGVFDAIAGYRLSEPLGYWNALGIFAALGVLLAVALVVGGGPRPVRVVAAASLPMLALTVSFTFSRGAWAALALGLLAQLALDPARGRLAIVLLTLAPAPALAVLLGLRSESLTRVDAALADAASEGHRLLGRLVVLTVLAAAGGLIAERVSERVERVGRMVLALAACSAAVAVVAAPGAPHTLPARAWHAFSALPPSTGGDLNRRLYSFSGSGRVQQWEVALDQAREHPVLGNGAGSYEAYWLEHRRDPGKVRDAHSLYVETFAELGVVGLALLLAALLLPVYAAIKARRHALVPAALGAYIAYLVHAGVDWDWEMPAVTLTAVFIGAALLVAGREPDDVPRPLSPRARGGAVAVTLAAMVAAFVGLVGNMALSQSAQAARGGDWNGAIDHARSAQAWAPWSPEPEKRIGDAELALGRSSRARASYKRAIGRAPNDWSLWFDLARASAGLERRRALARAAELNPLSPEIEQFRKELR
jgi:tetratricopeptide (TPR) repeat protein